MSSKAQRRGSDYRRKRKRFHANQYTRKVSDTLAVDCISASAKKLCKENYLDKELTARRNRTENATQLQRQLLLATGRKVSSQTARNRLHEGGLYAHESQFSLESDTRRVLVWRDRGTRKNPAFVRERSQYRRAGWMVWGGISIGGPIGDSFVFQDDNARPHRARLVENMLEAETIQRMEWPACSPDLNPIEHVWDMLGRRIAARPRPPATIRDLEIALLEEWNSIPQSLIDNFIASMANKCAAVLAV
ncbi:transposable element Tcb2 transposase [Trichonephila clavipes]|nr:transposable element Tcb2 transposase [Trichonephila clavipes]